MNPRLRALLEAQGGVLTRAAALELPAHLSENALKTGKLRRLLPGVYVDPTRAAEPRVRALAALAYAGPGAALSHRSALVVWGLPGGTTSEIHLVVPPGRQPRVERGIVVHRRAGFDPSTDVRIRDGLPVTRLERTVLDSWPLLRDDAQRAPVIAAVAERMTTPARLLEALAEVPNLRGRAQLVVLIDKLTRGCRSELELWGHDRVFHGLPGLRWQVPMRLGTRTIHLDLLAEDEQVNGELDGAKWHGSPAQRERDARRDAALAAKGIHVVRFTHDRLIAEPDEVRREWLAILASRREQGRGT